jgi:hypothetical protein
VNIRLTLPHESGVGVGCIPDHDDPSMRQSLGQQVDQLASQLGGLAERELVSSTTFFAPVQPHQDRQGPGFAESLHVDAEHDPHVAPVEIPKFLGR